MNFNIANKAPQTIAATAAGFFAFAIAINMTPAYATIQSVEAKVDISEQRMRVFVNGVHKHTFKVSTAGRGYRTPTGTWKPYRIHKMWYSRKYDNAPMPPSIFYNGVYAVHATNAIRRLGRPASHGCVRLHPKNAKTFFGLVLAAGRKNTTITVAK